MNKNTVRFCRSAQLENRRRPPTATGRGQWTSHPGHTAQTRGGGSGRSSA